MMTLGPTYPAWISCRLKQKIQIWRRLQDDCLTRTRHPKCWMTRPSPPVHRPFTSSILRIIYAVDATRLWHLPMRCKIITTGILRGISKMKTVGYFPNQKAQRQSTRKLHQVRVRRRMEEANQRKARVSWRLDERTPRSKVSNSHRLHLLSAYREVPQDCLDVPPRFFPSGTVPDHQLRAVATVEPSIPRVVLNPRPIALSNLALF